jgi:hypothetical protein
MENRVLSSQTPWNAMNIYVLLVCTRVVMGNVFIGQLEWRFNDSNQNPLIVLISAI